MCRTEMFHVWKWNDFLFFNIYLQSFLDIVVELEKLDQLSSEKMDLIEHCLRSIHRADLAKKISHYQQTGKNYQLYVVIDVFVDATI